MLDEAPVDHYEILQVSVNAEPETVHRVYRLLAQRYHPDNAETGNDGRFRQITEAYRVLSDPHERARYDATYHRQREARWKLANLGSSADTDFETELQLRVTLLEVLYTKRRVEPQEAAMFLGDLARLTGAPVEHLEFTSWYLVQKKLVQRNDRSMLAITAEGVDYLEEKHHTVRHPPRLAAANT